MWRSGVRFRDHGVFSKKSPYVQFPVVRSLAYIVLVFGTKQASELWKRSHFTSGVRWAPSSADSMRTSNRNPSEICLCCLSFLHSIIVLTVSKRNVIHSVLTAFRLLNHGFRLGDCSTPLRTSAWQWRASTFTQICWVNSLKSQRSGCITRVLW